MDLRQLHALLAVVDHGSFSAAADALFTVQSNVSSHVARLEAEVGATLLDRRLRTLTPAGEIVVQRAREVLRQIDAITDDLASLDDRVIGEVSCGATPSIGLRVIPAALARSTHELPEVAVSVTEAHSDTLFQQLLANDLDVAITTVATSAELHSDLLFTEEIVAVVASSDPLGDLDAVTIDHLGARKLLLPLQDNPLHQHIDRAFRAAGVPLRAGLEVGSSALVQAMASADVGVALVPATAAVEDPAVATTVLPIVNMGPRQVALTRRASTQPSRALQAFSKILEETARAAARSMPRCHLTSGLADD